MSSRVAKGKSLEGKGRGSDKGPITVAIRVQGAQGAILYAWYQSVTRHGLAVTAEVAGSTPVVPAIDSNGLRIKMAPQIQHNLGTTKAQ